MERHFIEFFIRLDLPNGEAPGVPEGNTSKQKIKKALNAVMSGGLEEYGFTAVEMDLMEDTAVGIVLTHEDA